MTRGLLARLSLACQAGQATVLWMWSDGLMDVILGPLWQESMEGFLCAISEVFRNGLFQVEDTESTPVRQRFYIGSEHRR
jgi:hypothetical protein